LQASAQIKTAGPAQKKWRQQKKEGQKRDAPFFGFITDFRETRL
jgi:hypothetical protein